MTKRINTDVSVVLNSVDLSNWSFSIDTPSSKEQIDVSGFNPTGSQEFLPGTKADSLTVGILQDYAAAGPHATLYPLYAGGSSFPIAIKPTSAAVSATNPILRGTAAMYEYNGLAGSLNARGEFTATFLPANGSVWVWANS